MKIKIAMQRLRCIKSNGTTTPMLNMDFHLRINLCILFQISDIHVSIFNSPDRVTDLEEFCNVTLDAINPAVVLASGK